VPTDRDAHDERTARINVMLEELRLNTDDLHELAKQATIRSWQVARAARLTADDVRAQHDARPTKKTQEPTT
jgi:hypothetical protein